MFSVYPTDKEKRDLRFLASPCRCYGSGGRIRTYDLWVMSGLCGLVSKTIHYKKGYDKISKNYTPDCVSRPVYGGPARFNGDAKVLVSDGATRNHETPAGGGAKLDFTLVKSGLGGTPSKSGQAPLTMTRISPPAWMGCAPSCGQRHHHNRTPFKSQKNTDCGPLPRRGILRTMTAGRLQFLPFVTLDKAHTHVYYSGNKSVPLTKGSKHGMS